MKMQSSIIVMLLGSANERRLSSRRVRRGTKTGDGHQNYYKKVCWTFNSYRDLSLRNTCTIFVQVDDMLLMKWQFQNESLSQDSDYYLGSDYYWNIYWNSTELKYQIPFEKHPNPDAQVCSSFKFNFYISLI